MKCVIKSKDHSDQILKVPLQMIYVLPYLTLHLYFELDVGYAIAKERTVCCCYHYKCLNVNENCILIVQALSYPNNKN